MWKLFKHLGEHKAAVLLIILLLVGQAYCDLALPSYTSDIVDVGIQQGGIENAVPERMREETFDSLSLFMTEDEKNEGLQAYDLKDGIYERNTSDKETIDRLNQDFGMPMVILSSIQESGQTDMAGLKEMMAAKGIDDTKLQEMKKQAAEEMGDMSDSIITQKAILFIKAEYEAMGMDLNDVQMNYLLSTGAKMLGLTLLMMAAAILAGLLSSRTAAKIGMDLRGKVFTKVVSFSSNELNKFSIASLITRSTNDIQQVQMVEVMLLRMVLYAPIIGLGGIVKVASTRTGLGWIIGVAVAAISVVVLILMQIAMPKFKKMQSLVDRLNLVSREILTGVPVIRAFSREKFEEKRFETANKDLMRTQLFTNRVMTFMMPLMMLIMNGVSVLIVWVGGGYIDNGTIQTGDLIAFITYAMVIIMSFLMIGMISIMLPRADVAAQRVNEVLETKPTICDPAADKARDAELRRSGEGATIAFNDVSFRYGDSKECVLEHIDFTAEPGKTTALIGSTGSGKSTVIKLIERFYDVTEGSVTIDGVDVRDVTQQALREQLGYVPQKAFLFSGTIESNVAYADEGMPVDRIREAVDIAQASEFVASKEEGLGTRVSQGGSNVSGGQRQRLAIARALATEARAYLFDDSFSALDYKTDAALRQELHTRLGGKTVVIVAQRISTVLHADRIVVLDDGRIVGQGTHEELMETCEEYREIAMSQLSEAELNGGDAA